MLGIVSPNELTGDLVHSAECRVDVEIVLRTGPVSSSMKGRVDFVLFGIEKAAVKALETTGIDARRVNELAQLTCSIQVAQLSGTIVKCQ